jgi:hypothetical protein
MLNDADVAGWDGRLAQMETKNGQTHKSGKQDVWQAPTLAISVISLEAETRPG